MTSSPPAVRVRWQGRGWPVGPHGAAQRPRGIRLATGRPAYRAPLRTVEGIIMFGVSYSIITRLIRLYYIIVYISRRGGSA